MRTISAALVAGTFALTCPACGNMWIHGVDEQALEDTSLNLYWQNFAPNGDFTWDEANDYCSNLTWAEIDSWRLPNIYELSTEIAYASVQDTGCYGSAEWQGPCDFYWTSSLASDDPTYVLTFSSATSTQESRPKDQTAKVRCTRHIN
jgi:hypothetical protein